MKYKVGDKVKVRNWDELVKYYGVINVSDNPYYNVQKYITCSDEDESIPDMIYTLMSYFCGKEVTIAEVNPYGANGYYIEEYECDDEPIWADWMFEEVSK